jgi:hypothetical protein
MPNQSVNGSVDQRDGGGDGGTNERWMMNTQMVDWLSLVVWVDGELQNQLDEDLIHGWMEIYTQTINRLALNTLTTD